MVDISDLFQDPGQGPEGTSTPDPSSQILARLDAEEECVYVLAGREEVGLQLTVFTSTEAWTTQLTRENLASMATKIGIETEEFIRETERALTGQPLGSECFSYSVCREAEGLRVIWKRHLPKDNVKFQLGQAVLRQEQAGPVLGSVLDHVVHSTRSLKSRITQLEKERARLIHEQKTALEKYEQCVNIKEEVEVELYSKFKAVLNEKKDKIRRLIELESRQLQSAREGEDEHPEDDTKVEVESAVVYTQKPASSGLLGEPQEVVSPPVKRRKREPRQRAARGQDIPCPPSLSRRSLPNDQVKAHCEVPHSSTSAEGDDLLQLL